MTVELKQQTIVVTTIKEMKKVATTLHGQTIGLVPTMGYLHLGHMSLIKQSIQTCDSVSYTHLTLPTNREV